MKDNELLDKIDGVFGEYGGKKRFIVTRPKYNKAVRVAAPSDTAAIVAAAKAFGAKAWTEYEFYSNCTVVPDFTITKRGKINE